MRRQGHDQDAGRQLHAGPATIGYKGNINGDDYGAPDGLWFDEDGRLWIQTDQAGDAKGDWVNIGGNVMMCADPSTGETRRFLTSPPNCEVTGVITHAGRQDDVRRHPAPGRGLVWQFHRQFHLAGQRRQRPDHRQRPGGTVYKPRSGVVVITKDDGGVIGT